MRHITGFFLALAISAALFFGGGWGIARFSALEAGQGLRTAHALTDPHNLLPLAALLGTGLLLGILLAVRRVSALATGLPGLALLGWSALLAHARPARHSAMSRCRAATTRRDSRPCCPAARSRCLARE